MTLPVGALSGVPSPVAGGATVLSSAAEGAGSAPIQPNDPQFVLAVVLGLLFAFGTFLVLRRDVVRVVWGVTIISQSANVYLVTMGGLKGGVPFVAHGGVHGAKTDPLVQALVLTAIVIGFGTTAFALVLTYRVYEEHGTIDLDKLGDGA